MLNPAADAIKGDKAIEWKFYIRNLLNSVQRYNSDQKRVKERLKPISFSLAQGSLVLGLSKDSCGQLKGFVVRVKERTM